MFHGGKMKNRIEELYNELIETKQEFLEEIESEICMIGEIASLEQKSVTTKEIVNVPDRKTKMEMLRLCEQYISDIDIEMELIASYIELDNKVEELKHIIDDEISQDLYYKSQYEDLANSKLGKIQRFWWRKRKKL